MACPLDYSLCSQTVTLYRRQGNAVLRQVIDGCHYAWQIVERKDEAGRYQTVTCLLIVPGDAALLPGDRVLAGIGPEIAAEQWPSFIPVKVSGLSEIGYVKPCFWDGVLCHTEAGRK